MAQRVWLERLLMTAPAIEFPVIGISDVKPSAPYAFVARTWNEMHESPLHAFLRGHFRNHYFVDSAGVRYLVEHPRVTGLDLIRIKEVGVVTSVVSALLSGFDFPVMVSFDLQSQGRVEIGELREKLLQCLDVAPRLFTLNVSEQTVRRRLKAAKGYAALAAALTI
jgi:hypothetical protein